MSELKAKKPKEVSPGHCKGILFGKPGAGKTWFALNFPKPYYIDTESGASLAHYMKKLQEAKGAYMGPHEGSNDMDTIIDQVKALATESHPYKTLIIDSITKVFQSEIAKEMERLGDKDAFGASKKPAVGKMRRLLNWISRLDMNVWFVAHEVEEWQTVGGERKSVGRTADAWEKLMYELHLALRVEHPGKNTRTATVVKSRLLGFPEYDVLNLQKGTEDMGYQEFSERYGKDFIEQDSITITLATADQIAEINSLLENLKVNEKDIEKILSKADAETVEDMTTENAQSFIEWMVKKVSKQSKKEEK